MKRGRKRTCKLKPHETLDGLKRLANEYATWRGHNLKWWEGTATEAWAICSWCNRLAICIVRPAGQENVLSGLAVNQECPHRQQQGTIS